MRYSESLIAPLNFTYQLRMGRPYVRVWRVSKNTSAAVPRTLKHGFLPFFVSTHAARAASSRCFLTNCRKLNPRQTRTLLRGSQIGLHAAFAQLTTLFGVTDQGLDPCTAVPEALLEIAQGGRVLDSEHQWFLDSASRCL